MDTLGIVLINYHSEEEIIKYIKNELSHIIFNNKIVIVNNSNSVESEKLLQNYLEKADLFHQLNTSIFIITKDKNLGYARANNFGALFLKNKFNPDFILFSNSDISLKDNNVVDDLILKLKSLSDDIAVIGPRVLGLDGKDQSPHPKISFKRYFAWRLFPFFRGKFSFLKKKRSTAIVDGPKEGKCYWISGCFMLVKSSIFFEVAMFDEQTFLYGEESILAERLNKVNNHMYIYPKLEIIHFEGGTTNKSTASNQLKRFLRSSTYYYYNKYIGAPKILISILKFQDKIS